MSKARVYRTEAVVLKGYDYGEADRILTLYTPQLGKLRAIVKGVRKTKSRKAGHLDLFTRSNLLLARGRQLDIVTEAETIESFQPMRKDLGRSSQAHYVAELVDSFTAEGLANYSVYALTIQALRRLASAAKLNLVLRSFELRLLSLTGYRPQLQRCLCCDSPIQPQINHFSSKMGGVLCPDCSGVDPAAPSISVNALKILRNLQANEAALLQVDDVGETLQREVEKRMQEYIIYRLESRPKSLHVLDRLSLEGAFE